MRVKHKYPIHKRICKPDKLLMDSLFASNKDGITILDDNFTIQSTNKTIQTWYAHAMPLDGKKCYQAYRHSDLPCIICPTMKAIKEGCIASAVIPKVNADHQINGWLEITSYPLIDHNGKHIKGAIEYARDITEHKHRLLELEAIASVSSALRSALTAEDMYPIFINQIMKLIPAEGVALSLLDQHTGDTVFKLGEGQWQNITGVHVPSAPTMGNGERGKIDWDPCASMQMLNSTLAKELHAISCIPLTAHGQTIGAIWVGKNQELTRDEELILTAMADIAANAIRRVTLQNETERRLQHLESLRTIDIAISTSLDVHLTLDVLLEEVINQLKVDAACVFLYNPALQMLEFVAGNGFKKKPLHSLRFHMGESFIGKAAFEQQSILLSDLTQTGGNIMLESILESEGFTSGHTVCLTAKGHIKGILQIFHRKPVNTDPEWFNFLRTLAGQAALAVEDAELFSNLQRTNQELAAAYDATIEGWAKAVEMRDMVTEGHSRRVADLTVNLAVQSHIVDMELIHIRRGALMHDIGKMGIPDKILLKPAPLNEEEIQIMRLHPTYAYELLSPITYLRPALEIPLYHHEHWDGNGYPQKLRGVQIPLAARIFAVVDVWDALTSDRPYRKAWSKDKARHYIQEQAGQHFDPNIARAFLALDL